MSENKILLRYQKLGKALNALERVVDKPVDLERTYVDSTIQRFEFTIELFWKFLKAVLENQGMDAPFPKIVFQESFRGHFIEDEKIWLQMLRDRNNISYTYEEELADKIYKNINTYVPILKKTYDDLSQKLF